MKKKDFIEQQLRQFFVETVVSVSNKEKYDIQQTKKVANRQNLTGTQYPFFFYKNGGCGVSLKKRKDKQRQTHFLRERVIKKAVYSILKCTLVKDRYKNKSKKFFFYFIPLKNQSLSQFFS